MVENKHAATRAVTTNFLSYQFFSVPAHDADEGLQG